MENGINISNYSRNQPAKESSVVTGSQNSAQLILCQSLKPSMEATTPAQMGTKT